jgi:hypothetical protein
MCIVTEAGETSCGIALSWFCMVSSGGGPVLLDRVEFTFIERRPFMLIFFFIMF